MPQPQSAGNAKKDKQINVKMEGYFQERFEDACKIQHHSRGQLARILIEWARPFYEHARSVEALYAKSGDVRRAVEIEREAYERAKTAQNPKQSAAEVKKK